VNITHVAFQIHNATQRHATEFEEGNFLPIQASHAVVRVWHANERDMFIAPIALERFCRTGTHRENFCASPGKICIAIPQARQRRAAVRSHEPAQEIQHDDLLPAKIKESEALQAHIIEFEVGRKFARGDQFTHQLSNLLLSSKSGRTSSSSVFPSAYFAGSDGTNTATSYRCLVDRLRRARISNWSF